MSQWRTTTLSYSIDIDTISAEFGRIDTNVGVVVLILRCSVLNTNFLSSMEWYFSLLHSFLCKLRFAKCTLGAFVNISVQNLCYTTPNVRVYKIVY